MRSMQRGWLSAFVLSSALASSAAVLAPSTAEACGGCFAPPGAVQTVTDHRMVLSVSSTQTTLWDQFAYSGRPSDFSWILPVRNGPDVRVELADNRFMQVLDNLSVPTLYAPQRPTRYCASNREVDFGAASPAAAADAGTTGVTVHREEVVGPYAIAVVGGTDAMAIRNWLRDNGFSVPAAIEPVIDYYVGMRSDFVALKLRPGTTLNRMSPVRVTVPGYAPTLPLRMVAAGIADKVGLTLLVLANSRFEATNYPNGEVRDQDLVWDWNSTPTQVPADDFRAAERTIFTNSGGRAWITESAMAQFASNLQSLAERSQAAIPGSPVCPSGMVMDSDGGAADGGDAGPSMRCVEPTPGADMRVALEGLDSAGITLTRMRAELSGSLLDRDLQLGPTAVPSVRDRNYRYGVIRNPPPEPPPCANPSPARPTVTPIRCTTVPAAPSALGFAGFAMMAVASARALRRKSAKSQ
jgi:hypothetical protein